MNIDAVYALIHGHFRSARFARVAADFKQAIEGRILDVGGSWHNWQFLPPNANVTILNITEPLEADRGFPFVRGDGRLMPFKDQSFDLVFCNSVIEHVGTFESQTRLAAEIERVANNYFVQTPNRWFPVEPHFLTPLIHFLPTGLRGRMIRNFTLWGLIARPSPEQANQRLADIRLLTPKEMRTLFPSAAHTSERFLGFKKALIAAKHR